MTWNDGIEYTMKMRNMMKQVMMMNWRSEEQDEEYSRAIVELVEMKLLRGLVGVKDEKETLISKLKCDASNISISWC